MLCCPMSASPKQSDRYLVENVVEVDPHVGWAAEYLALPIRRRVDNQPRVFDSAQKSFQHDVDFRASKWTTHARVFPAPSTEVLVCRSVRGRTGSGWRTWPGHGLRRRT